MSINPWIGLLASLLGVVMAFLGFAGYVGMLVMSKTLSLVVGTVGIVAIACSYAYTFHYPGVKV